MARTSFMKVLVLGLIRLSPVGVGDELMVRQRRTAKVEPE